MSVSIPKLLLGVDSWQGLTATAGGGPVSEGCIGALEGCQQ